MLASNIGQTPNPTQTLGEVTDVISCGTCGARALTTRPLYPPILRVPVTAPTLDLCLVDLLKPQPLSDRRCAQCLSTSSEISTEILMTPQAKVIQLLRFQQGTQVRKNTSSVTLSPTVRLDGATWRLNGIVNHTRTLHQGHYTAYVYHQHRWYRCDDARVAETPAKVVFSSSEKSAYLIFLSKM